MYTSVDAAIASFQPGLPLAVAYSGGADSTALLLAVARRWPGAVRAVHVHHGLQAAARDFEDHCRRVCAHLGVPLWVGHVDARHTRGQSPEEAARRARYTAIRQLLAAPPEPIAIGDVALAHQADDQIETILLALSRGAGLPGLAAMPRCARRDGLQWHRPLLDVPAADIRAWLRAQGVGWIEDPTNADPRYVRNRLRLQVLPALTAALPQARTTFARSARHAAEAQQLLEEVAADDLARSGDPPALAVLQALSEPRRRNVLRYWLRVRHGVAPTAAQLAELSRQVVRCVSAGHDLRIKIATGFARRCGPVLQWAPQDAATTAATTPAAAGDGPDPPPR